jgi:formylglycine-generating enzyme required for sulfatase activity
VEHLLEIYRNDPDAGIHGAAEWTLRRWKQAETLKEVDAELKQFKDRGDRRWYLNEEGQTFVVIDGRVEFTMGSPQSEPDRRDDENLHGKRINRRFAVAAKEVTVEQYQRFLIENPKIARHEIDRYNPEPTGPMKGVTWYEATAYCNWLSQQEGLATCYEPNDEGQYAEGMRIVPDALERPGYRLPTEAEWEYACRAGAVTSRYYGRSVDLLGKYAWHLQNSQDRACQCGQLLPNELGLFDMLGNLYEWCQEQYCRYPEGEGSTTTDDTNIVFSINDQRPRVLRGGAFGYPPGVVRSAFRGRSAPAERSKDLGFRPSRAFH